MTTTQSQLRAAVALMNQALEIADAVPEPLVAIHLANALVIAELRLEEHPTTFE
jgi:hypothetical protein